MRTHFVFVLAISILGTPAAFGKPKDKIVDTKYCTKLAKKNKERRSQWAAQLSKKDSQFVSQNPELVAVQTDLLIQKACLDAKTQKITQKQFIDTLPQKIAGYAESTYEEIAASLQPEIKAEMAPETDPSGTAVNDSP
jgi:hypothetical protein